MLISILTLFPEMFEDPFSHSIIKRAQEKKFLKINLVNIRQFTTDKRQTVDGRPYGGGRGMILRVDVIDRAIKNSRLKIKRMKPLRPWRKATWWPRHFTWKGGVSLRKTVSFLLHSSPPTEGRGILKREIKESVVLLDPQGKKFSQKVARKLSKFNHLILICGHYEGVDERIRNLVDEEISIGDYVLTGGEIPAMVVVDAVTRLIPQVLKTKEATQLESFSKSLLEYPQYTRPPKYRRWKVPQILLSGNHGQIEKWRGKEALKRTKKRRPDLALTQKG